MNLLCYKLILHQGNIIRDVVPLLKSEGSTYLNWALVHNKNWESGQKIGGQPHPPACL